MKTISRHFTTLKFNKIGNPKIQEKLDKNGTGFKWDIHSTPLVALNPSGNLVEVGGRVIFGGSGEYISTVSDTFNCWSIGSLFDFVDTLPDTTVVDVGMEGSQIYIGFVFNRIRAQEIGGQKFQRVYYLLDRMSSDTFLKPFTVLWHEDTGLPIRILESEDWVEGHHRKNLPEFPEFHPGKFRKQFSDSGDVSGVLAHMMEWVPKDANEMSERFSAAFSRDGKSTNHSRKRAGSAIGGNAFEMMMKNAREYGTAKGIDEWLNGTVSNGILRIIEIGREHLQQDSE